MSIKAIVTVQSRVIKTAINHLKKQVFGDAILKGNEARIKVTNNTSDTLYLFNTYFEEDLADVGVLYRFDNKNNQLKVSFLPLVTYLSTTLSDVIKRPITNKFQRTYSFDKIAPFSIYEFRLKLLDINNVEYFYKDFDTKSLTKFQDKINFKKTKNLKKRIPLYMEFAYYNDVSLLCNKTAFFTDELNFDNASKNYEIIKIPVKNTEK